MNQNQLAREITRLQRSILELSGLVACQPNQEFYVRKLAGDRAALKVLMTRLRLFK